MKATAWITGSVVLALGPVAWAGSGEADGAAFGDIGVTSNAAVAAAATAIGEGGPRDNWGLYLRGSALLTAYNDADFTPTGGASDTIDFDGSLGVAAAVGYRFWNFASSDPRGGIGFRVEGEISYEEVSADDDTVFNDVSLIGFAANGYFDWAIAQNWTWYLGAGVGVAEADGEDGTGASGRDNPLFVQAMTGFGYTWGGPWSVYGGLRARGYDDMEIGDGELTDLASASLEFGVMVSF
ncbi:MAG: outer membrane protein [Phycisphaerales bacterium JB039]